jgi:hypothetical protein
MKIRSFVACAAVAFAVAAFSDAAWAVPVGTGFSYQGRLLEDGLPYDGTADIEFRLYDAADNQIGAESPHPGVSVTDGLFTVNNVNAAGQFGANAFNGELRKLELTINGTALPKQVVTPVPYALALPGLWTQQNATSPNLIGGYFGNLVAGGVHGATIGGGGGGGALNEVSAHYGTVAGGVANKAWAEASTVGGGNGNVASGLKSTIAGGISNVADGERSTVGGGEANAAHSGSAIAGGYHNTANGAGSVIGGGSWNVTGSDYATVPGGLFNVAGGSYSLAAGLKAFVRDPAASGDSNGDEGTFVWADAQDVNFQSSGPNQFLIRAAGGVGVNTNAPDANSLTVNGLVRSMTGGFKFPDGTVQTTAATGGGGFWTASGNDIYNNNTGNVGIGTTSPIAELDLRSSNTQRTAIHVQNSTVAQNYIIQVTGSAGTGREGNLEIWRGDPWGIGLVMQPDGDVGIGTSAPEHKLDVNGALRVSGTGGPNLIIRDTTDDANRPSIQFTGNSIHFIQGDDTAPVDTSETFAITSICSGTRTHDARLNIHGKATGSWGKYISITHDGTDGKIETDSGSILLNPAGNVGIGTTSPSGKLHVSDPNYSSTALFERSGVTSDQLWTAARFRATKTTDMGDAFGSSIYFEIADDTAVERGGSIGVQRAGADNTSDMVFLTVSGGGQSERMRIRANGSVGIGETSALSKLHIQDASVALPSGALHNDVLLVEDTDAVLGLYSAGTGGGTWGSAVVLGEISSGALVDKWAMVREATGDNLQFKYGSAIDYAANPTYLTIDGGSGIVSCKVLQITGGSDLSEQFDVCGKGTETKPGMVVCIDPKNPGKLVVSTRAYDRTVAGVISGAGGVTPGMMMGQKATVADGGQPVALTGRVYVMADAGKGAIEPGDQLTTSNTPGHAMKVSDHAKAQGAIIGKAMTSLGKGRGLVLVLVSLQ